MADLSLDLNSASNTYQDLLVANNDLIMTSDLESGGTNPILQDIIQTIRWYAAEWFLDITQGFPWFQEVFIKNPDVDKCDALLLATIQSVPGVLLVTTYSSTPNFDSRSFSVSFSAQTTTGIVSYTGNISF